MKPVNFQLLEARSSDEARQLLAAHGDDARLIAGGQSLVPLLNFRMARPRVLIDLNLAEDLVFIREAGDGLAIGAMTRQRSLERSALVGSRCPLMGDALPLMSHPPIRNRGTLGGSLSHADPAAELATVCLALDAVMVATSTAGTRRIAAKEFFTGALTTALRPEELLTEIHLPPWPGHAGCAFEEIARVRGGLAMVGVAAVLVLGADRRVVDARLAYASMGQTPLRARNAEAALRGQPADRTSFAAAAEQAVFELDPGSDVHASAAYRSAVAKALTRRALSAASTRAAAHAALPANGRAA
ncbi:MAG: xanthine dehydrogenase family protein subunit M [Casimicrobiaceae bacterium]